MIYVQMTRDMNERKPKLFGLLTLKQFIGAAISVVLGALILILVPLPFMYRILVALVPALPIMVIACYPSHATSPLVMAKYYLNRLICGPDIYIHDGDSEFYKKKTETQQPKVKRYKKYEGIR